MRQMSHRRHRVVLFAALTLAPSIAVQGVQGNAQAFRGGVGPRGGFAAAGPRGGVAVGPRGGTAVRGPAGGGVAVGPRGGTAVRGPAGGGAAVGPYGGA